MSSTTRAKAAELAEEGGERWDENARRRLVWCREQGWSHKEIGEELGRSNTACRVQFTKMATRGEEGSSDGLCQQAYRLREQRSRRQRSPPSSATSHATRAPEHHDSDVASMDADMVDSAVEDKVDKAQESDGPEEGSIPEEASTPPTGAGSQSSHRPTSSHEASTGTLSPASTHTNLSTSDATEITIPTSEDTEIDPPVSDTEPTAYDRLNIAMQQFRHVQNPETVERVTRWWCADPEYQNESEEVVHAAVNLMSIMAHRGSRHIDSTYPKP